MVVITIIGVLMAAGLVSYSSIIKSTRDSRRAQDMDLVVQALKQFYIQYGCLPIVLGSTCVSGYSEANFGGWDYSSQGNGFMSFLTTAGFLQKDVADPINNMTGDNTPAGTYAYRYYCYPTGPVLGYFKESPSRQFVYVLGSGASGDSNFTCK